MERRDAVTKRPLRGICFVAPDLDRVGGYELATRVLARALTECGVPVLLVSVSRGASSHRDVDMIRVRLRSRHTLLEAFPRLFVILARERRKYSVIHCPTFGSITALAVLSAQILRCPSLIRVASPDDVSEFGRTGRMRHRLLLKILRLAARAIAPSRAIANELKASGFAADRILYLPNCVDIQRFRPPAPSEKADAKRALGLGDNEVVIGTVARLVEGKGIDVLLRAFTKGALYRRARLVIVGDGPLREDLTRLSRQLKIDSFITWLGLHREPSLCLRAMDAFVFSSLSEGSPNAVLEAMATALPIVATNIAGIADLVKNERTGLLVPANDPDALAAALVRLLNEPEIYQRLGEQARIEVAERFALSAYSSRLIQTYQAVQAI